MLDCFWYEITVWRLFCSLTFLFICYFYFVTVKMGEKKKVSMCQWCWYKFDDAVALRKISYLVKKSYVRNGTEMNGGEAMVDIVLQNFFTHVYLPMSCWILVQSKIYVINRKLWQLLRYYKIWFKSVDQKRCVFCGQNSM